MSDQVMAKKDGAWTVISLAPDVCKTPMGSSTPPVPYPVIAKLGDAVQVLEHIRSNGAPLVVFDQSQVPQTVGDQAGTATGVKSGTVGDVCEPKGHSSTVNAGGKPLLRHGDDFWMNKRNTVGVIVGETAAADVPAAESNPPLAAEIPAEDQTGFTVIAMVQNGTNLSALANAMGEHAQLVNAGLMGIAGDDDGASEVMLQIATPPPPTSAKPPRPAPSPGNGARSLGKSLQRKVPPTDIEFRHVYADGSGISNIPFTAYLSNGAVLKGAADSTGLSKVSGQPAGTTARIVYGSNPHPGSCNIRCESHPEADSFLSHTFKTLSDDVAKGMTFITSGQVLDSLWDQVVGDFHWLKAVVYGQFEDDRPLSAMVADMLVSFVPGVIIATSARDLTAVVVRMVRRPERREDTMEWILLIGCVIPLALPLIGAAAGAFVGAIAGSELGAFLRVACLTLLEKNSQLLVKLVGFLRKFVKGDIVNLLKQINFANYTDAVVQYLTKFLNQARLLCFQLRQQLAKLPFASQFTKTIQKLQELEHAFYDIQVKAISKVPQAMSELSTRLADALKQTAKDEPHAAFPGKPAPPEKPPIKPGDKQHAGINNNPLGTPPKTTNVPPPPKVEPETNLHVEQTREAGAKAIKPPPDNWKTYKTYGITEDPRFSPEGKRLIMEFQKLGYSDEDAVRNASRLMETGSTLPLANPVETGDRLYKVIPEGSMPGVRSEYWATKEEVESLKGLDRDEIADKLGIPLESQQLPRYDVVEIQATRPTTVFVSEIAPTTQNGWSQAGGGMQTLVIDRSAFTSPVATGTKLP